MSALQRSSTLFILFLLILNPFRVLSQNKIGTVNSDQILDSMPEMAVAKVKIDSIGKAYNIELQELEQRFDLAVKQGNDDEAGRLQLRLYKFKDAVDSEIEAKSDTLFKPIRQKVSYAIYQVAKEGKYSYVLDSKYDALVLYVSRRSDITAEVKKKLGLFAK